MMIFSYMKQIIINLCVFCWALSGFAQQRTVERIYVTTDRDFYVSGESVWLSLYCFDMTDGQSNLSGLSNVAYLELHSSVSTALTAKIAISNGRGSGKLDLPPTLPTGNYRLIAYTKQMLNEDTLKYFDKIIPIYNTLTSERIPGNVVVEPGNSDSISTRDKKVISQNSSTAFIAVQFDHKKPVSINDSLPVTISNEGKEWATISVSVFKVNTKLANQSAMLGYFLAANKTPKKNVKFSTNYVPEYEGEIIHGKINNVDLKKINEKVVFLSAVGRGTDIYASAIDTTSGELTFYTGSIYGNREVVLQYPRQENVDSDISFELIDPFVKPSISNIPELYLSKEDEPVLTERSIEMQIGKRFGVDTLYEKISIQKDPLLYSTPTTYTLDDYTRFPGMQDVIVELIPGMRFRKVDKKMVVQVHVEQGEGPTTYQSGNSLILLDGIPVFDHSRILQYDPLKINTISIYRNSFYIGEASFDGLAKFYTYKGDYPGLTFDKSASIMDYQGVQYPCKLTINNKQDRDTRPDMRSLLYWDPEINLMPEEKREILIQTPSIPGKYSIVIEGITDDGEVVYREERFSVK